jgi:hypothetical protein
MKRTAALLSFLLFFSCAYAENLKFKQLQNYDPAYYHSDFMDTNDGLLSRWENGSIFTKDPFSVMPAWKKGRVLGTAGIKAKVSDKTGSRTVEALLIKDAYISNSAGIALLTLSLGNSVVTTICVYDLKNSAPLYTAELWAREVKRGRPSPIPMKNIWLNPSMTSDAAYAAFEGYNDSGGPESGLLRLADKKLEKLKGAAMIRAAGDSLFFCRANVKERSISLHTRKASGGSESEVGRMTGGLLGLETLSKGGYLISETKVYKFDIAAPAALTELHDFSYLKKGAENTVIEKIYSGINNGKGYIFFVVKKVNKGKYDWKLYGMQVE